MSTINPTKKSSYIDARLSQVRLVSEHATCTPALPNKETQQVRLRIETTSGFTIGLDKPESPTIIVIAVNYKAMLKAEDTDKLIVEYEATHEAQFTVAGWAGFDDWLDMPTDVMAPYLTVVNNVALKKAEATILDMGIKGASLPQPERLDGILSAVPLEQGKSGKINI